ncbi:cingulin-like protein 1 isoform X2 [Eublepharis macularius]|uniref:Cingulin-like protein 1 isoform X2 n=1 Tax=Eublepharis macularius TaxID=481883 RepID=A0AA97KKK0_EUBMA|nr:cingulin-like protein 1 isoform X2 [Eublepharis macularius]
MLLVLLRRCCSLGCVLICSISGLERRPERVMESCLGNFKCVQQPQHQCRGVHLRLANSEASKAENTQNSKAGSYGVSIRVQGIDGHPYVVLNNTEGNSPEHLSASENGQRVASLALNRAALDSASTPELEEENDEDSQCLELPDASSGMLQGVKLASAGEEEKSASHFSAGPPQPSSLLNFQRHPELLQPYDPEKNTLNLDSFQTSLFSKSKSVADEEKPDTKPRSSPRKLVSLDKTSLQFAELAKANLKTVDLSTLTAGQDRSEQEPESASVIDGPNGAHGSLSSSGGSTYAVSSPTSQETRKCQPDLLPFRRQDSAGSVLNGSRRSSTSSTTPTSAASLYKFFLDDQECAIYADNVNRHENRRYIPFLPGTGRDIDTGSIPAVDQLIEKFDKKAGPPRRGRLGIRSRIHPDDRKRSRSVDSVLPSGLQVNSDCFDECSKDLSKSSERLQLPPQVSLKKPLPRDRKSPSLGDQIVPRTVGKLQATRRDSHSSHFNSLQYHQQNNLMGEDLGCKASTLPLQTNKSEKKTVTSTLLISNRIAMIPDLGAKKISAKSFPSASNAQATPDLLKGQQELAQQTNEETAKQILYNYLKEGSSENDDATKRKVNLVFEKIQTLKSRAAGSTQVSDTSAEVKALVEQKERLEKEVLELQRALDLGVKNQQNIKGERDATRAELKLLQRQLQETLEQKEAFRKRVEESEKDLRQSIEELFQVKMEREQHQTEIRDLQDQLSEMHDELDAAKHAEGGERGLLIEELMQLKEHLEAVLMAKEQQEEVLRKRERELTALKGALKEEVSTHDQEMDKLREQQEGELQALRQNLAEAVERAEALSCTKACAEEMQRSAEERAKELADQNWQLQETLAEVETQRKERQQENESLRGEAALLEARIARGENDRLHLEDALAHAKEEGRELASAGSSLEAQLEEAQRSINQLSQKQQRLTDQLKEEANQKDQLKRMKSDLEKERWQLDQTIEKLHKEMAEIMEASRVSTLELQTQLDEYKEKNRRELSETQRQLKEKNQELEKARLTVLKMQEEVHFMEEELRDHQRAQDEATTKMQLLEQTVKALEYELEAKNHLKEDRARQSKIMEDKMSQLELELDEERNNADILSERISRCREQIEQMRNELFQERAVRQDLECDKISLERQNKDLKSRILHLEGFYRSSKEGLLVQMEARIVELEEQLENEERDRANLQLSNRRLERKVKELVMQADDEHLSLTDQKDQLSLRLKAMKRQVEEAEEEIDRLESTKKKLQRELEEQVDFNDQLQGQLKAIKKELRHRKPPNKVLSELDDEDDDDFSTDGESLYEAPSGFKFLKDAEVKS